MGCLRWLATLALVLALPAMAAAPEDAGPPPARPADLPPPERLGVGEICDLIAESAAEHGLPPDFFARLIYKESRFDARARSPVGAEGIAQFMPATARMRGLIDPWDPEQAIPHSAYLLADLRRAYGNLGLAAAAYNAGEGRVDRWLWRGVRLPWETVDYVRSITFRPVEWFRQSGREVEPRPLEEGKPFDAACRTLQIRPTRAVLARSSPWGVQIAGGRSYGVALRAANRVKRQYAAVLAGRPLEVIRSRRGIRGAPYQARIGAASRREAGQLCQRLKQAGGVCVVLRN